MNIKATIRIEGMELEGISPLRFVGQLRQMKRELEAVGCQVVITVNNEAIDEEVPLDDRAGEGENEQKSG